MPTPLWANTTLGQHYSGANTTLYEPLLSANTTLYQPLLRTNSTLVPTLLWCQHYLSGELNALLSLGFAH